MTTEPPAYRVRLDRAACDGIFACLVRDDRFTEGADGLATIQTDGEPAGATEQVVRFQDDRVADAKDAAAACPLDAIEVTEVDG